VFSSDGLSRVKIDVIIDRKWIFACKLRSFENVYQVAQMRSSKFVGTRFDHLAD
jgi:hypothetical protein